MTADTQTPTNDPAAHELLRGAHAAGYRFPAGFSGFRAALQFTDSEQSAVGTVEVRTPSQITLDLDVDESSRQWVLQEMASIVGHRWPTPYEQQDGRYNLTLVPEDRHPIGRLIQFNDDRFSSSYRVRGEHIAQVNREIGKMRFSISILEHSQASNGKWVASQFTVVYWNTHDGRLVRADAYSDSYVPVDGVDLPESRRVITASDDGLITHQMTLRDHELLPSREGEGEPQDVPANGHPQTRAG
jgi:hypothetical protein